MPPTATSAPTAPALRPVAAYRADDVRQWAAAAQDVIASLLARAARDDAVADRAADQDRRIAEGEARLARRAADAMAVVAGDPNAIALVDAALVGTTRALAELRVGLVELSCDLPAAPPPALPPTTPAATGRTPGYTRSDAAAYMAAVRRTVDAAGSRAADAGRRADGHLARLAAPHRPVEPALVLSAPAAGPAPAVDPERVMAAVADLVAVARSTTDEACRTAARPHPSAG